VSSVDDELSRRLDALTAKHAAATRWGDPTYDSDCLRVWNKHTDFMADPRFVAAYQAGMRSDHRLDRHAPETVDIHIEWRIHVCCWAAWHAKQLVGDFVECGTNTGIMSLAVCHYIDFNSTGKRFFLFDTYRGIPEDQIGSQEAHALEQNLAYRDCFATAQRNFDPFPNAILVRGKVPHTLPTQPIDEVCYLMLDMNIVHPEREALAYFWEKLVPGAIVLFDDYGWLGYEAQKNAHDAFAAAHGVKIMNLPTGQGMLIKP
jgi:O-methyltransferase